MMKMSYKNPDLIEFWKEVFDDVKEWYKTADSKAAGIIAINAIILTISTLGFSFLKSEQEYYSMTDIHSIVLYSFLGSILLSVIFSIKALWARIKIISSSSPMKGSSHDLPEIFFSYIADKYPTNDNTIDKQGMKFFGQEMKQKTFSDEVVLEAIARQITILASNVKKKYLLVNLAYLLIIMSMALLAFNIALRVL